MRVSSSSSCTATPHPSSVADQLGLAFWLFLSYLAVSISLPITPLFVAQHLGMSNALGGLAVGIAFVSTVSTRGYVGRQCDRIGGKPCMIRGLATYALASLLCALAAWLPMPKTGAYLLLICGRLLLGLGESQALLGSVNWGISMAGRERSGRFMAWLGAGIYGSFALGGPLGLFFYNRWNYTAALALCVAAPLLGLLALAPKAGIAPVAHGPAVSFWQVVGSIWRQGAVLGLQGVGFAVLGAFLSIDFLHHQWTNAGAALCLFALGFALVRLVCGSLPDRFGGFKVTAASLTVETIGLLLLWLSPSNIAALTGALLTGTGCSMIFPAMGVEVVRIVEPQQRGSALGGFAAFQDIAYMISAPLAGLLADHFGISIVFLIGAGASAVGLLLLFGDKGAPLER